MNPSHNKTKAKPKKSHLQYRFDVAKRRLNRLFKYKHHKQSEDARQFEIDCTYLIHHIESYGFRWFPNHYIRDDIAQLEKMLDAFE